VWKSYEQNVIKTEKHNLITKRQ